MRERRAGFDPPSARSAPPVADLPDRACAGVDTEIFFPTKGQDYERAINICRLCRHREPCLDWALDTGQQFGVLGATTPEERFKMIKRGSA